MPRIETDTNQVYRKKYFVPASSIIGPKTPIKDRRPVIYNPVINARRVVVTPRPVRLNYTAKTENDEIRVEVIKSGTQIKGLKITCPCGRHTELDVAYGPSSN